MNKKLLGRVKKAILKYPEKFDMDKWVFGPADTLEEIKKERCGTTACIAGWACFLADGKIEPHISIGTRAMEVLDIQNHEVASDLFNSFRWPAEFRNRLNRARSETGYSKIAAEYINYFVCIHD